MTDPLVAGPVGTETHWYTLLIEDLKRDEGYEPFAYDDDTGVKVSAPHGNLTIGYGTNLSIGLTQQEATILLVYRLNRAIEQIQTHYHWFDTLSDARKRAVANMMYTLGMSKFVGFVNFIAAMEGGNYGAASEQIVDSKWHSSKAHDRAERIRLMVLNG